ncbi:MAG: complex I NDUFA9 subunit family protein [Candidatus Methanoperedens sp.]|nr:complex I NDUFA9 subunit family protein [Candidatus Methanoperedens sp.]
MILVTGGTGFVGSHIVQRLAREKITTRCLVREGSKVSKLKDYGVELAFGDMTDKESLKKALNGAETVIHLVGIIVEKKGATFEIIHTQGTRALVDTCKEVGVKRFIYISALGARENAQSRYHITKWEAEQSIIKSGMEYVIFRPSIMIGEGGEFITMLSGIIQNAPVIPVIGAKSKLQPIYVENTVDCVLSSLVRPEIKNKIFDIGGPDQISYRELYITLAQVLGIKKPVVEIPVWMVWPAAYILENIMEKPALTTQQLMMLKEDNICDMREIQKVFGLQLMSYKDALNTFI